MNLKIDTSGLGESQSALDIKSVVDAALSDPAKKPVFDSILADLEPAINSVKFNTSNKFTWSSAISPNGDLIISVNPNSDVNKFDADSLLHHELTHHTAAMNAMSSAAVDAFIKTAPESWRSLSVKYGAAAESVLNYGFEEFFNQISNNQYRLKYGLKPVASIGAGTQGAFSFADFSSMVEIAKANPAEFKATILDYINEYVKQNSLKGGALEDFLSAMNAETSGVSYRANGAVDYWRSPDGSIGQTRPGSQYSKEFLDFYGKVNPTTGVASAGFGATLAALADQLGLDGEFGIQGTFASSSFQVPHARASVGSALNAVGVAAGTYSARYSTRLQRRSTRSFIPMVSERRSPSRRRTIPRATRISRPPTRTVTVASRGVNGMTFARGRRTVSTVSARRTRRAGTGRTGAVTRGGMTARTRATGVTRGATVRSFWISTATG